MRQTPNDGEYANHFLKYFLTRLQGEQAMINRQNFLDTQEFLRYHSETMQHDQQTVHRYRVSFRAFLTWADDTPLPFFQSLRPTFPVYVANSTNSRFEKPWSLLHMERILKDVRNFLAWACKEYPGRYKLSQTSIDSLRLSRTVTEKRGLKKVQAWTIDDILTIAKMDVTNIDVRRNRAAIAFLYLSGMRISAFATLPISCVDIARRKVYQLPEKGVKTKNRKAAITSLLPIPELLDIVEDWDCIARASLPDTAYWFASLEYCFGTAKISHKDSTQSLASRRNSVGKAIRAVCSIAGIEYLSAHKLRHGHALYGMKHAKTIEELKALSQNLMHSSITITDGIYGNLTSDNVGDTIASFKRGGTPEHAPQQNTGAGEALQALLAGLQNNPDALLGLLKLAELTKSLGTDKPG